MAVYDWILGVMIRPAATFEKARDHLRFGYLWILMAVITVDAVAFRYGPVPSGTPTLNGTDAAVNAITIGLFLFQIQGALFFGTARLFRWAITWPEACKYVGLSWGIILLEDLASFYPSLKGLDDVMLWWVGIPFLIWHLLSFTAGVKRITGLSSGKALLFTSLATLPWRAALYALYFYGG